MKNRLAIISLIGILSLLSSCSEDETPIPTIDLPDTYTFLRNGESTVSFSGQTTRLLMAEEIVSAMKNPDFTQTKIDAMFAHVEGENDFVDETEFGLNASSKNVRSKTAASADYFSANATLAAEIKEDFDGWIASQVGEVYPNWEVDATAGVAGQIQEAGGGSVRYVNAQGLEYDQAFGKALIGALMVDQILNNYISTSVLDAGENVPNNDASVLAEGNNYTTMEHKWDEAYGYAYAKASDTADPNASVGANDSFLFKYIGRVESDLDFAGISEDIFNAFKMGRAAIVAGDYEVRDAQAAIIREKISMIIGIRAVYYLQQAKAGLETSTIDYGAVFHDLSEGYGFIYSLKFTRNPETDRPYFSDREVETMLSDLMSDGDNGFWDVKATTLESISNIIADQFPFTVAEAGS